MDGLWRKTLLKWMIWGYHYFWKHPNILPKWFTHFFMWDSMEIPIPGHTTSSQGMTGCFLEDILVQGTSISKKAPLPIFFTLTQEWVLGPKISKAFGGQKTCYHHTKLKRLFLCPLDPTPQLSSSHKCRLSSRFPGRQKNVENVILVVTGFLVPRSRDFRLTPTSPIQNIFTVHNGSSFLFLGHATPHPRHPNAFLIRYLDPKNHTY